MISSEARELLVAHREKEFINDERNRDIASKLSDWVKVNEKDDGGINCTRPSSTCVHTDFNLKLFTL